MPIEVRELIIRARIEDAPAEKSSSSQGGNQSKGLTEHDMQKIISLCAEEVMNALKRQKER
ncbi:MAG: DUF5908 family protein [Chitinophagaceae bacterium]